MRNRAGFNRIYFMSQDQFTQQYYSSPRTISSTDMASLQSQNQNLYGCDPNLKFKAHSEVFYRALKIALYENIKLLDGMEALVYFGSSIGIAKCKIVKGYMEGNNAYATIQTTTKFTNNQNFQYLQFLSPIPEVEKLLKKSEEELNFLEVIRTIDYQRNNEYKNLESNIKNHERDQRSYLKKAKDFTREILQMKNRLGKKFAPTTQKTLKQLLDEIKNHYYVHDAYMTNEGLFIITTKNLKRIFPETNKIDRKTDLGRFVIEVSYRNRRWISIYNLDYKYEQYLHPNVLLDGETCLGGNYNEVYSFWRNFELYSLVDFMIMFLSIMPQDRGTPYISHENWLKHKTKYKRSPYKYMKKLL